MNETREHVHESEGADACMITKDEAAGLAGVTTRTIELWAADGLITKFTVGPAGYWVRFCREQIKAAKDPVAVLIDSALARLGTSAASASGSG